MREVLSRYLDINAVDVQYIKGKKGKPYLSDEMGTANKVLQFNLSHCAEVAILAISQQGEVGVDIESIDRKTDWQGIVKRFFTVQEQQALFSLPQDQQRLAFYELWTRKEAYMKVLGTGLSLSPTAFCLTVPPEKPALLKHYDKQYQTEQLIDFQQIALPEQYNHYTATLAADFPVKSMSYYQYPISG